MKQTIEEKQFREDQKAPLTDQEPEKRKLVFTQQQIRLIKSIVFRKYGYGKSLQQLKSILDRIETQHVLTPEDRQAIDHLMEEMCRFTPLQAEKLESWIRLYSGWNWIIRCEKFNVEINGDNAYCQENILHSQRNQRIILYLAERYLKMDKTTFQQWKEKLTP